MENLKELINKTPFIIYEYYCPGCDKFFWVSKEPEPTLFCPWCGEECAINGELPIKDIKFEIDEKKYI